MALVLAIFISVFANGTERQGEVPGNPQGEGLALTKREKQRGCIDHNVISLKPGEKRPYRL
jgi:hypothetical protein